MKRFITYASVVAVGLAIALPAFAVLNLPTPPPASGPAITGQGLVDLITQIVNYFLIVAVVIAVAVIVYSGVKYALGDANAKSILLRAVIGLAIILGVGLIINTVQRIVSTGSIG